MAELLRVPEVAAGATQVMLSEWLVGPGDQLSVGEAIAVVETEKAVVEIEATTAGVLLRTLVDKGAEVDVGAPVALLGSVEEQAGDIDGMLADLGVGSDKVKDQ